jgi:hypothetical protein
LRGEIPEGAQDFTWTYSWTFTPYAFAIGRDSDPPVTGWLEGGKTSAPFSLAVEGPSDDRRLAAARYLKLGFTRILPYGIDHVLFVLGVFLLGGGVRSVLWQVGAFTVAHSITLGLSLFGLIAPSPALVQPVIALAVAYVAIENLFFSELRSWRVAPIFAFGLPHGLVLAGALHELDLPRSELLTALVTFNLGVEAAQSAVIGAALVLVGWRGGNRESYRRLVVVPASLVMACTGVYWTVTRLALL